MWSDIRIFPNTPTELVLPDVTDIQAFMEINPINGNVCMNDNYLTLVNGYQFNPNGNVVTVRLVQDIITGSATKQKVTKIAFAYGDVEVMLELRRLQILKFVKDAQNYIVFWMPDRIFQYTDPTKQYFYMIDYWSGGVLFPFSIMMKPKIVISNIIAWEINNVETVDRNWRLANYYCHREINDHILPYPFNLTPSFAFHL